MLKALCSCPASLNFPLFVIVVAIFVSLNNRFASLCGRFVSRFAA